MERYALIPVILLFLWSSTRSLLIECSRVVYLFLLSSWVCLKFSLDLSVSSDIFYGAGWVVIPSFHFLSWKVPLAPSVVTSSLLDTAFRFLKNKNKMECFPTVFSPFLNHHLPCLERDLWLISLSLLWATPWLSSTGKDYQGTQFMQSEQFTRPAPSSGSFVTTFPQV